MKILIYIFPIIALLYLSVAHPQAFKKLLKLGWVLISLIISMFVFLLILTNCEESCSTAELWVALVPLTCNSLYIWYQLFMKPSD